MTGQANVGVSVIADVPEVIVIDGESRFDPAGPPASSGGAGVPVMLPFVQQPVTGATGVTLAPVRVAIQDGFGRHAHRPAADPRDHRAGEQPRRGNPERHAVGQHACNGVATFSNLSINQVGTGYTLIATSRPTSGPTDSAPFNVVVPPTRLAFTVQPTSTPRALTIAPPIQVAIQDSVGNVTASTATVQLQILNNAGGGTLTGTTISAAVNGIATFNNLSINLPGAGYIKPSDRGADLARPRSRSTSSRRRRRRSRRSEHGLRILRIRAACGEAGTGTVDRDRHLGTGHARAPLLERSERFERSDRECGGDGLAGSP